MCFSGAHRLGPAALSNACLGTATRVWRATLPGRDACLLFLPSVFRSYEPSSFLMASTACQLLTLLPALRAPAQWILPIPNLKFLSNLT